MLQNRYTRSDALIAVILTAFLFFLGFINLENGMEHWGDDSAAYISQGIAIYNGTLSEQARVNYFYHPSPLDASVPQEGLVYPWGYPLILSGLYALFGFDTEAYSTVFLFKLPSLIAFALACGLTYLLFRRRLPRALSAFGCILYAVSCNLIESIDTLYSDHVFLLFSTVSILLSELYPVTSRRKTAVRVLLCVPLAVSFWAAYETRLNGIATIGICLLCMLLRLHQEKERVKARDIVFLALPYVLFGVLLWAGERILLPPTHKVSDTTAVTLLTLVKNVGYYIYLITEFLGSFIGRGHWAFGLWLIPFLLHGVSLAGFRRENLHLTALILGTLVVLIYLPFQQSYRYMYHALPFVLMYLLIGLRGAFAALLSRFEPEKHALLRRLALACACVFVIASVWDHAFAGVRNLENQRAPGSKEAYSEAAVDMYGYIRENTSEDSVICFFKPRQLYLATGRLSFRHNRNGHNALDAQYYLEAKYPIEVSVPNYDVINDENRRLFRMEYENSEFAFYSVLPSPALP